MPTQQVNDKAPLIACPNCGASIPLEPAPGKPGRVQARCNHGERARRAEPVYEADEGSAIAPKFRSPQGEAAAERPGPARKQPPAKGEEVANG